MCFLAQNRLGKFECRSKLYAFHFSLYYADVFKLGK